ncbi:MULTISPECIES: hypothetical protein [Prochlorococcus]|uniref:hypothetical protein n=1 Tax=Prochlorococcus TaxID=1218 RepID=UPI0002DCB559|nr:MULTISPECIES: hypothetical protein [Prochlorococcus]KGG10191.1 putative protein family PM-13 [Prochlorococcus marinus str. LG]KGG22215.1 putative protein family PM-13 [Prochlorococcus marinus str. SS2]KGG24468.1 putative protein family PM-13 [Prochlorococcus marinus str. SS35]KGG33363.1 putative protein family PM-13 [Prochlorococcus marinus str. SS51]KGG35504.1 putative protein family PM-13 [Prochlorococcus sp. SS52]
MLSPKAAKAEISWSETFGISDCKTAIEGGGTPADFSSATALGGGYVACYVTPSKYEITLYKIGICTSDPLSGSHLDTSSCTLTLDDSSGVLVDLGSLNQAISLPQASIRPDPATYTHMMIVMGNSFKLKGSYTTTNGTYHSQQEPGDAAKFVKDLAGGAQDFTHSMATNGFNFRTCTYNYQRTVSGVGVVRAVVADDDEKTVSSCTGNTRIVGVFNPDTDLVITEATNGLEVKFTITDSGMGIESNSSESYQPRWGWTGDFIPAFVTF